MQTRTALVTGATGAIGKAIAMQMAELGYQVTIIARDEVKAAQLIDKIIRATGNKEVDYIIADLSLKADYESLESQWMKPLDVLINNAACAPPQRHETPEGIELQFATNVLSYFWMINALLSYLKMSAPSRIVNVASYWAGNLDLSDLQFRSRPYNNDTAYRQSKQANRMLTVAFAEKLKRYNIAVNAVHPGDVNSVLSNNLGYGGHETPDQGAETPVWAATANELQGITGKYFEHRQETPCRFSENKNDIQRLFEICEGY